MITSGSLPRQPELQHSTGVGGIHFLHQIPEVIVGFDHLLQRFHKPSLRLWLCEQHRSSRGRPIAQQSAKAGLSGLTTPKSCMSRALRRKLLGSPGALKGGADGLSCLPASRISVGNSSLHVAD